MPFEYCIDLLGVKCNGPFLSIKICNDKSTKCQNFVDTKYVMHGFPEILHDSILSFKSGYQAIFPSDLLFEIAKLHNNKPLKLRVSGMKQKSKNQCVVYRGTINHQRFHSC